MKVLHTLNALRPSGAEMMLKLANDHWISEGIESSILSWANSPGDYSEDLSQAGFKIYFLRRSGKRITRIVDLIRLFNLVKRIRPNVIHIHSEFRFMDIVLVGTLLGIPTYRTIHNVFLYSSAVRIKKVFVRKIARFFGLKQVSISHSVFKHEKSRLDNETTLIWDWFSSEGFAPGTPDQKMSARIKLGLPTDKKIVVTVGNGSEIKNYSLIIKALKKLQCPEINYYQVGHAHRNALDQNLAEDLSIEDSVKFVGPSRDIVSWLWAADVFVMPSLYEGFGLSAAEAISAGCNCVFSNCPGLIDFRDFGIRATWVDLNVDDFADAIYQACFNADFSSSNADENHRIMKEAFSPMVGAKAYSVCWKNGYRQNSGNSFSL